MHDIKEALLEKISIPIKYKIKIERQAKITLGKRAAESEIPKSFSDIVIGQ